MHFIWGWGEEEEEGENSVKRRRYKAEPVTLNGGDLLLAGCVYVWEYRAWWAHSAAPLASNTSANVGYRSG